MATVTAAIVLYNRAGYIATLLSSLFDSQNDALTVRAVVVDNGSEDTGADVARGFGDSVRVIRNEKNRPLAQAVNQSIRAALEDERTDYVLVLNDDVSLREGCLARLVKASENNPSSLLTPLQLQYDEPHDVDQGAVDLFHKMSDMLSDALLGRSLRETYLTNQLIGAVMFAPRALYEHIGYYDELFLFYGPDTDYCTRAKWLGFQIRLAPLAHALHAHGRFMHKKEKNKGDYLWRWRRMTLGRYLLGLKNPNKPLWRNYLTTFDYTFRGLVECATKGWMRGALTLLEIQGKVLLLYPAIRRSYRRDFDPARRLPAVKS